MKRKKLIRKVIGAEYLPTTFHWHILFIAYLICDKIDSQPYWYLFQAIGVFLLSIYVLRVFTEVSEHPSKINELD